jgi:mono/diheme cytochrome c family protein
VRLLVGVLVLAGHGVAPEFNMTPWKGMLKDDEIWNVVNYLRSIAKKK